MKNTAAMLTAKFNFQKPTCFSRIALIKRYTDESTSTIMINGSIRTDFNIRGIP